MPVRASTIFVNEHNSLGSPGNHLLAFKILNIGLQPTKTRAELDSSTVYLKQIFYEYHYHP